MSGPLSGVHVLDAGTAGVGPYAATLLAMLGANVVKIEPPKGDRARAQPPFKNGLSTAYCVLNMNKRMAVIDIKLPESRQSVERLARQADIVMDNLRPGVLERLGLDLASLNKVNPAVVSASAPAWGESGPMRDVAAVDYQVQMMSGFASLNGAPGSRGEMTRFPYLDFSASCMFAATALLGLIARERSGVSQRVVATHIGSALSILATRLAEFLATNRPSAPMGSGCAATTPHRAFECQNGEYILVGVESDEVWRRFCQAIMREDLVKDARLASNIGRVQAREELEAELETVFRSRPSRWWVVRLQKYRVPFGRLMTFDDLLHHSQIRDNGYFVELNMPGYGSFYAAKPPWIYSATPLPELKVAPPGQHTQEVLQQGFGAAKTARATVTGLCGPPFSRPLQGLRVLDTTQGYAGPFTSLLMAEAGAEVIKVEPPQGDYARGFWPSWTGNTSAVFAMLNRNKTSVQLDLDTRGGRQRFWTLIKSADIVVEDWGPGIAELRGLSYSSVCKQRPGLIFCSITPFGRCGPFKDLPISELVAQGWAECMQTVGAPKELPDRIGADLAGLVTGALAFLGVLAALYHRIRTGAGQRIDISVLGAILSLRSAQWAAVSDPDDWAGIEYCDNQVTGRWLGYRTKDRPIYFNLNNCTEEQYFRILDAIGMLEDVVQDPRFGNSGRDAVGLGRYANEVRPIWEKHFASRDEASLVDLINSNGGAAALMLRTDEVFEHPQIRTLELLCSRGSGPPYIRAPWKGQWPPVEIAHPPACGEHTWRDAARQWVRPDR